jgi:hypothetical protein
MLITYISIIQKIEICQSVPLVITIFNNLMYLIIKLFMIRITIETRFSMFEKRQQIIPYGINEIIRILSAW